MKNGCFRNISGHFLRNYMNIFHKTENQMTIVRCSTGQNLKAYVSQKILNWHSLRHSHSAEF